MGSAEGRPRQPLLDAIWRSYDTAVAQIRAMPNPDEALKAADALAAEMVKARSASAVVRAEVIRRIWDERQLSLGQLAAHLGVSKARAQKYIEATRSREEDATVVEPVPVVAAIVTSRLGVLVGRRNDGSPPWTFIAGEIEPGESAADAAVREVKEECGLLVKPGRVIGRRVHPKTGRTLVYIGARPVHGTDVFVGDEDELAEVRWVTLSEAEDLMQPYGMFEPVRKYLSRSLHSNR